MRKVEISVSFPAMDEQFAALVTALRTGSALFSRKCKMTATPNNFIHVGVRYIRVLKHGNFICLTYNPIF